MSTSGPAERGRRSPREFGSLLLAALRRIGPDHLTNLAASVAYYGFLAIPSALLVALGVFSLVASPQDVAGLLEHLEDIIPAEAITLLEDGLSRAAGSSGGGIVMIIVGGAVALWTLSGAMTTFMWALNGTFDRTETRGFVRRRLVSLAMLAYVVVAAILLLGLLVLGPHLSGWIGDALDAPTAVRWIWWVVQWPILLLTLFATFSGVIGLGPDIQRPRRFVTVGGVVAVTAWLIASGAFALYSSRFGSYNKTWGSLSAVIVTLTWLWLSSLTLLVGAEVDAEDERRRQGGA